MSQRCTQSSMTGIYCVYGEMAKTPTHSDRLTSRHPSSHPNGIIEEPLLTWVWAWLKETSEGWGYTLVQQEWKGGAVATPSTDGARGGNLLKPKKAIAMGIRRP